MERCEISLDEKTFIIENINLGLRNDGRQKIQYRPLEIETDCVKRAMGSARVRIGENIVIATVKGDMFTPPKEYPDQGKVEFHIDCSPEAKSKIEWQKKENHLRFFYTLNQAYSGIGVKSLCIVAGVKCWKLEVIVLVVSAGGGLYDAISFAVKAALRTLRLPSVKQIDKDGSDYEIKINEHELFSETPLLTNIPNIITLCKIGNNYVVDPSFEESLCSELKFIVSINEEGKILSIFKDGCGCVHPSALKQNCEILAKISKILEIEVNKILKLDLEKKS